MKTRHLANIEARDRVVECIVRCPIHGITYDEEREERRAGARG